MLSILIFCLSLLAFDAVLFVHAGLYVINPQQGSTCLGGKPCTIDWLDDGESPLLPAIGRATVGLYVGRQRLVQAIEVVDVSSTHSLTFTPKPEAGPNSSKYYISFVSVDFKNNSVPYSAFSPFFRLDRMTGSSSPDPSAPSSFSIPPSTTTTTNDVLTTVTVGTLSTSSSSSHVRSTSSTNTITSSQTTPSPASTSTAPVKSSSLPVASSGFVTAVLLPTTLTIPSPSSTESPFAPTLPTNANTSSASRGGVSTRSVCLSTMMMAFVGLVMVL